MKIMCKLFGGYSSLCGYNCAEKNLFVQFTSELRTYHTSHDHVHTLYSYPLQMTHVRDEVCMLST